MNKHQQDIFRMYQSTFAILNLNNGIWNTNIPFSNAVAALGNYIDDAAALHEVQSADISGITEDKKIRRLKLEESCNTISGAILFYATVSGNRGLKKKMDFTRSDYTRARDEELTGISMQVYAAASANDAALIPFGVTAAMINALQTQKDDFTDYIGKPKATRSEVALATKKIPKVLTKTTKLLEEQVDKIMELFRNSNADFYKKYFIARKIVNTAQQKRALKASFIHSDAGAAAAKLKIKIDGKIKRVSSAKGVIYVQHLEEGRHFLEAALSNGEITKVDFNIIKGETTKVVVKV